MKYFLACAFIFLFSTVSFAFHNYCAQTIDHYTPNYKVRSIVVGNSTEQDVRREFGPASLTEHLGEGQDHYALSSACYVSSKPGDDTGLLFHFTNHNVAALEILRNSTVARKASNCTKSDKVDAHIHTDSGLSLSVELGENEKLTTLLGDPLAWGPQNIIVISKARLFENHVNLGTVETLFNIEYHQDDIHRIYIARTMYYRYPNLLPKNRILNLIHRP